MMQVSLVEVSGIDRYLVKGLLDGREQQGMERRRLDGGIGGDNCASWWPCWAMIMPEPLHIPPTV